MESENHQPKIEGLTESIEIKAQQLIREGSPISAIMHLREATGCSLADAKKWVDESLIKVERATAPCPYCEMPLRTQSAKQCRHCKKDWHDPDNIKEL